MARFRKVLDYIDAHLDEELRVERLSSIAMFSTFHFHRQFTEIFEISVCKYARLNRLKRACYQLAFRDDGKIVDIALASGYEGPEAFSRAFRKSIGQSPSEFRRQPQWESWSAIYQPLRKLRQQHMGVDYRSEQVRVTTFEEIKVAVFEHRGDPLLIGESIRKFIEWRKQNHLPPRISDTFNIFYNDPSETESDDFRLDLCASIERDVVPNDFGIIAKIIPGGRCAVLRHIGSDDNLGKTIKYLYMDWLPRSGEELRDYPLYAKRIRFFPDVLEHDAVTDVFLPLSSLARPTLSR